MSSVTLLEIQEKQKEGEHYLLYKEFNWPKTLYFVTSFVSKYILIKKKKDYVFWSKVFGMLLVITCHSFEATNGAAFQTPTHSHDQGIKKLSFF